MTLGADVVLAGLSEARASVAPLDSWQLRPATVVAGGESSIVVAFDGEGFEGTPAVNVTATSLVGYVPAGARVMIITVPPAGQYAISRVVPAGVSEWVDYSPQFLSNGVQPSVGDGTVLGRWLRVGYRTIVVEIWVTFGAGASQGTGRYSWSAPFAIPETAKSAVGASYMFDSGTANRAGVVSIFDSLNEYFITNTPSGDVGAGVPQVWASGDQIKFSITHEVASFDPL